MKDLISRQDALKAVSWDTEAYTAINNLPAAEVEVAEEVTEEQVRKYCLSRRLCLIPSESYRRLLLRDN